MIIPTIILGWIGVFIFFVIAVSFQKMSKNNEMALMHFLMAMMYALWLPLPIALNESLKSEYLQIGTIFGLAYLIMLVITMILQTGHITYIVKNNDDQSITDKQGDYIMATLSNPFEGFVNVLKSIWALFLAITFWNSGEMLMANFMILFTLFAFYYLFIILNTVLVTKVKLFSMVKPNPYITNLETILFFMILMCFVTFNS